MTSNEIIDVTQKCMLEAEHSSEFKDLSFVVVVGLPLQQKLT